MKVSWEIKDGRTATVAISIDKHRHLVSDGWGNQIEAEDAPAQWKLRYSAKVAGVGEVNDLNCSISDDCPAGYAGQLGQLGFNAAIRKQIEAAITEVEASDDWQQHLVAEAEARQAEQDYQDATSKIERAMGE